MWFKKELIVTLSLLAALVAVPARADVLLAKAEVDNITERREAVADVSSPPLTLTVGTARVTLSGLIEVEGSLVHVEGDGEDDDLRLCTAQIGLEAELTPWFGGHVVGLWEEDDTEPMEIDEAVLTLTSPWQLGTQIPALRLGRQYLPFGRFDSSMISDPLTLDLGETRSTSAVLALTGESCNASLGIFEGSVDDGDDGADSWVLAIEAEPCEGVTLGASWLSDLAESDAGLVADEGTYRDEVAGWSAFVALQHGSVGLNAEYLAAVERFEAAQVDSGTDLTGRRPRAFNLELSWQVLDKVLLAARYEAADDFQDDVRRFGVAASYGLCDFALLAVEYLHADADRAAPEHTFTAQLAVEF